ncbi:recombinase family protein [Cucumibacter marinus]|uniref:recombinase family protein n=1 Tax=Cucumibacter marinus TaxID=1121252 RepID=UPI0003FB1021|nr:recombinase family protein [Cucumibacter marinus]
MTGTKQVADDSADTPSRARGENAGASPASSNRRGSSSARQPRIRCAIYTRKSSEEGLEQDFNSLDAQFEAASAYIMSQHHEGWRQINTRYDDGGISGGTLDRPGLVRLMADIKAGRIDMVVVYKIDRLTRSLADFAKLVETFEAHQCSFVSVTQSFNTSTSMGRLTLNVLLSFAQFEREVTAERIRDKIAASKKKGMWMGGTIPLGYDRHPDPQMRHLVINENESSTVRRLFTLYQQLGCVNKVIQQANREGLRSKIHSRRDGSTVGGNPFSTGQIYYLLRNPTYLGLVRHKQTTFPGQHQPIIDKDLWDNVQDQLKLGSARKRSTQEGPSPTRTRQSPLIGKLFDEQGQRLTPSHASKKGKRHRYYVSRHLVTGRVASDARQRGLRLPAGSLEDHVAASVANHLTTATQQHRLTIAPDAAAGSSLIRKAQEISQEPSGLLSCVARITLGKGEITTRLDEHQLGKALDIDPGQLSEDVLTFTASFQLRRRGVEAKLISPITTPSPDRKLIEVLAKAHGWLARHRRGETLKQIAETEGHAEYYVSTRIKLAFLSPRIQEAILSGTQPSDLSLETLMKRRIPIEWQAQETRFGFSTIDRQDAGSVYRPLVR